MKIRTIILALLMALAVIMGFLHLKDHTQRPIVFNVIESDYLDESPYFDIVSALEQKGLKQGEDFLCSLTNGPNTEESASFLLEQALDDNPHAIITLSPLLTNLALTHKTHKNLDSTLILGLTDKDIPDSKRKDNFIRLKEKSDLGHQIAELLVSHIKRR